MSKDLYRDSGVDIEKGDALVDWLQANRERGTSNKLGSLVDGIGGFAGLFRPNFAQYKDPLLVASTDGVGTKLLLAIEHNKLNGVGIDLVAMCVNDLYCIGARPMFFIDYYATGVLSDEQFKAVLSGIKAGLQQCQTFLLGGETAELPGLYAKGHFDLAGFVVGMVDGTKKLGPELVKEGDLLFALPSNGFHSNGYSLVRKWASESKPSAQLVEQLLTPTLIYNFAPDVVDELGPQQVHGLANITGGGISGNLPRVLPKGVRAEIDPTLLPMPDWMRSFILSHTESVFDVETVFNLGCGMIAVVDKDARSSFAAAVRKHSGTDPAIIGSIKANKNSNEASGVTYL